ncbi:MAG TPA: hypothetical protein VFT22_36140 [Kofleriaceae bacterium]|nr:hypothetical protein [Kofleriaceae bacterium]
MKLTLPLFAALVLVAAPAAANHGAEAPPPSAHAGNVCRAVAVASPAGSVELSSDGIAELSPREMPAMTALHVRMVITNAAAPVPWSIDVTTIRLELGGRSEATTFANSDLATLPIAIVDRGERVVLDLYFAVPAGFDEHGVPAFAIRWQLKTPDGARTLTTRLADDPAAPPIDLLLAGWGGHWWYDATYPWPLFDHRDGRIVARAPRAIEITQTPRWYHR